MNQETQNIRDLQLQEYRASQQKMADYLRPAQAPTQKASLSSSLQRIKSLLDEITALNIGSLNTGGNTKSTVDSHLDQKLHQLYDLINQVKTEHNHKGKLI